MYSIQAWMSASASDDISSSAVDVLLMHFNNFLIHVLQETLCMCLCMQQYFYYSDNRFVKCCYFKKIANF